MRGGREGGREGGRQAGRQAGRLTEVDAMNGGRLVQGDTRQCVNLCLVQVGGHGTRDDRAESRATERAVGT